MAVGVTIDLTRCKRCKKRPRGKMRQEWARLEDASVYVRSMPGFLKGDR